MLPTEIQFPEKQYFKIGEVSKLLDVPAYVLRYWEREFKFLHFGKTKSRHRVYTKKDVETLLRIKHFLYNEKYTITGVKKNFKDLTKKEKELEKANSEIQLLEKRIEVLQKDNKNLVEKIDELNFRVKEKDEETKKNRELLKEQELNKEIILEKIREDLLKIFQLVAPVKE